MSMTAGIIGGSDRGLGSHDLALIENTLDQRARWLAFPAPLERQFEADTGARRSRLLIWRGSIALFLFDLFFLSDLFMVPDMFRVDVAIRVAMTLFGLTIIAILTRNPPAMIREGLESAVTVLATAAILYLMAMTHSPLRDHFGYGILLVIMFAVIAQRIRFWYSLASCLCVLAMTVVTLSNLQPAMAPGTAANTIALIAGAVIYSLIGGYGLEQEERLGYLQSLRQRLRANELEDLSSRDPLTGLGNRRALDRAMVAIVADKARIGTVSVLILDIDFFKSYNDNFGHPAGDRCIQRVAATVAALCAGPNESVFRFGGEEFIVLLAGVERDPAIMAAERIRLAIEQSAIAHCMPTSTSVVTASLGVATQSLDGAFRPADLINEADTALYKAKRRGRNQVWHAATSGVVVPFPQASGAGAA